MRQRYGWIALVVLLAFLATSAQIFAAGQTTDSTADSEYPLKFLTVGDSAAKALEPENDRVIGEINNRLGIKLSLSIVPQGSWDKINVAIASGDLPDVVVNRYPTAATSQWIHDGVIIPLNDYFGMMPTVKAKCEEEAWTAVDGKFYGYPFITQKGSTNSNIITRGDWLEELGMDPPKTLEEFYDLLVAFRKSDFDGNGQLDTYGITLQKPIGAWTWVFHAYGLPYGDWAVDDRGNVIPRHEHSSFRPGMEYIKRIWDNQLIDPEFMLNDRGRREEKWYQGKAGVTIGALFRHVNRIESNLQKINPQGKLVYFDPPTGPGGKRGLAPTGKAGNLTAVTVGSQNPEKAARFVEFIISPEGRELLNLGIEGVHFTRSGDKINYIEEERAKENFAPNGWAHPLAWGHVTWPLASNYLPQTEPQRDRALDSVVVATRNQMPNLVPFFPDSEIEYNGIVTEIYNQYFMDMMTGKIGLDAGIAELKAKWRDQGGQKILDDLTAYHKANK